MHTPKAPQTPVTGLRRGQSRPAARRGWSRGRLAPRLLAEAPWTVFHGQCERLAPSVAGGILRVVLRALRRRRRLRPQHPRLDEGRITRHGRLAGLRVWLGRTSDFDAPSMALAAAKTCLFTVIGGQSETDAMSHKQASSSRFHHGKRPCMHFVCACMQFVCISAPHGRMPYKSKVEATFSVFVCSVCSRFGSWAFFRRFPFKANAYNAYKCIQGRSKTGVSPTAR